MVSAVLGHVPHQLFLERKGPRLVQARCSCSDWAGMWRLDHQTAREDWAAHVRPPTRHDSERP